MAIHAESLSDLLKVANSLKIKECPLDPREFSAFRNEIELEMQVLGLFHYFTKPYQKIIKEKYEERHKEWYEFEKRLFTRQWNSTGRS